MKFVYRYRTSDNIERSGEIKASNRDAAFRAIRAKGIKPCDLKQAPGLINMVVGRWVEFLLVTVFLGLVLGVLFLSIEYSDVIEEVRKDHYFELAAPRHQIYGDPERMRQIMQGGFTNVFERLGDRLLAQFSQPGKFYPAKGEFQPEDVPVALRQISDEDVVILETDSREVRELKQIVNGMRHEMNDYLTDGIGTYQLYFNRLVERYMEEKRIRDRIVFELSHTKDSKVWEARNSELRRIGLEVVVMDEEK